MFNVTNFNRFLLVAFPCLQRILLQFTIEPLCTYYVTFYTQSKRLLLTIIHCSLYTESSFVYGGLQRRWPLVLRSLQLPHAFYTSMYLEVIAVLHYNNHGGVIHACVLKACISSKQSKCISAIKRIYSILPLSIHPRLLSCICVFFFLYCDACQKSSVLRVGVKTLDGANAFTVLWWNTSVTHNTIQMFTGLELFCWL